MQTVGPNDCFKWLYPVEQEVNIDGYNIYIDGELKTQAAPADRSVQVNSLTATPGTYRADIAPMNAVGEAPKVGADYRLVSGVPLAVTEVSFGPCGG